MHSSFTDIGQFREVIRSIRMSAQFVGMDDKGEPIVNREAKMPIINFIGTIKMHGTNAGVGMDKDNMIWYQARTHDVIIEKDNAGFAFFADARKEYFKEIITDIKKKNNLTDETVIIFGEWCGGNIQKGVAICGLDKMFVIFAVKVITANEAENYYLTNDKWSEYKYPDQKIYNINDYETYSMDIDFNNPAEYQNALVEITNKVEQECPVGKAFGVSGVGEGVVWVGYYNGNRHVFKVKGEKHSSSKVKKLATVDVEKINTIKEFVEYAVTENRLNQAIEQVFTTKNVEVSRKGTGDFLRWVVNDIAKEEMDTMLKNNLEPNDINKYISEKARGWFFNRVDNLVIN